MNATNDGFCIVVKAEKNIPEHLTKQIDTPPCGVGKLKGCLIYWHDLALLIKLWEKVGKDFPT